MLSLARRALLVGAAGAGGGRYGLCEEERRLSTQDKVRGTYENRIRFFASPEKMYETFASMKKEGRLFLSYGDFLRAVTPFNYSPMKDMEVGRGSRIDLCSGAPTRSVAAGRLQQGRAHFVP